MPQYSTRLPLSKAHSFPELIDELRNWFYEMRSSGNQVLRTNLCNHYIHLMEAKRTRVEAELFDPKFQLRLSNFKKQLALQKESDKAIAALSDEKTLGQHVSKARAVHLT